MRELNEIVVHCAATREGQHYTVDDIRSWHVNGRGWSDIGYHYVIYLDGTTVEGRPLSRKGAHVRGRNAGTIGICYVGGVANDGKTPKDTRTSEQVQALEVLLVKLLHEHPSITKISGHNQYAAKACPSFDANEEYRHLTNSGEQVPIAIADERIRYLQKLLALAGHYSGQHDGIIGPETRSSLKRYQGEHGLEITARFDDATVRQLREIERPITTMEKAVISDAAAQGRVSTTELGTAVVGAGAVAQTAREVTTVVNSTKDTVTSLLDVGPWILLSIAVAGIGFYIWRERSRKKKQARAVE